MMRPTCTVRLLQSRAFSTTPSISTQEVQKFAALSSSWWDASQNPLIAMNGPRVQFVLDNVQRCGMVDTNNDTNNSHSLPLHKLRALDIGCGGGLLSESLARLGAATTGLDPSTHLIDAARRHAQSHLSTPVQSRLSYAVGTVQEWSNHNDINDDNQDDDQQPPLFDIVCCLEVIEHVPHPKELLTSALQVLRPGGLLFVSTINQTYKSFWLTIVGAEYVARMLPVGTHSWPSYLSPRQVTSMVAERAERMQVSGMVLPPVPFVRSVVCGNPHWPWKLDPNDTDVNWIGCYQKKKKHLKNARNVS